MKANAPEKLWWSEGAVWHTNPNSISYVEYTRTDAFIEKACEFLKSYRQELYDGMGYIAGIINDKTIEDFRRAMEK